MKKLLPLFALILVLAGVTFMFGSEVLAAAGSDIVTEEICRVDPTACAADQSTIGKIITTIGQTLVYVVAGLSVLVIIIGGLMYVLSGGDGNNTKRAKDAIMYAVIGLVVALVAQGLVTFVLSRI